MILDGLTNDECISLLEKIKEEYNITSDIEEKKYTNIHDQTDICFMLSKKALPKYYVYEYNPKKTLDPETITFLESLNMKQDFHWVLKAIYSIRFTIRFMVVTRHFQARKVCTTGTL